MAIIWDQKVEVKWNPRNRKRFEELGYSFTGNGETFFSDIKHVTHGSSVNIDVMCDSCHKHLTRKMAVAMGRKNIFCNQKCHKNYVMQNQIHFHNRWSANDIKLLYEMYPSSDKNEIINALDVKRKWDTIGVKAQSLGIERIANKPKDRMSMAYVHPIPDWNCIESFPKYGEVYEIDVDKVNQLNDIQKFLISEIQRFCEENNRFPREKEMRTKDGYPSRLQYVQKFNIKSFPGIYKYIWRKKEEMPDTRICSSCNQNKPLTIGYFSKQKLGKFGMTTTCKSCQNLQITRRLYAKRGIEFKQLTDIPPEQWWEYYYNGTIPVLPPFCLEEKNIIRITRYVFFEKIGIRDKEEFLELGCIDDKVMKDYKIFNFYRANYTKLEFAQLCFAEFNVKEYDMPIFHYTDNSIISFIDQFIDENELLIEDLLHVTQTILEDRKLYNIVACKFNYSYSNLFIWYFKHKKINHPTKNRDIDVFDFRRKPEGFWSKRENRITAITRYCKDNNIQSAMSDTNSFKKWTYMNFKQSDIQNIFDYSKYYNCLYDVLIDAFPTVEENKLLFKWEWHQNASYTKSFLKQMLREFIFYRIGETSSQQIPRLLNYASMDELYPKFNKIITNSHYDSYFEWAVDAFPEYRKLWSKSDFNKNVAKDGSVCDSKWEMMIYEFIKYNMKCEFIKAVGTEYKGEYSIILPEEHQDNWYSPDFVIEKIKIGDEVITLEKPLYIEFYGMYSNADSRILNLYREKMKRKNLHYSSLNHIRFLDLYPSDIKDNFKGVKNKLVQFKNKIGLLSNCKLTS